MVKCKFFRVNFETQALYHISVSKSSAKFRRPGRKAKNNRLTLNRRNFNNLGQTVTYFSNFRDLGSKREINCCQVQIFGGAGENFKSVFFRGENFWADFLW